MISGADMRWGEGMHAQGESMQRLAECILEACSALPDSELSAAVEADARSNAKILFRQSVDAYKKVSSHVHITVCPCSTFLS